MLRIIHFVLLFISTIVEDWSLDRDPFVIDKSLNKLVPNPNLRSYAEKPEITKADWLSALAWNKIISQYTSTY